MPGVWPPVTAAGTRWIDGGVRSMANADLAAGYGRVVVLAPLSGGLGGEPGAIPGLPPEMAARLLPEPSALPASPHALGKLGT